ncbi:MAG: AtaL-like protein [Cyanobacteria bacterium P01_H01_bin.74]
MPNVEHFEPIQASLQVIWTVLLDRIENPERYMAGIASCTFLENTDTYAVRQVVMTNPGNASENADETDTAAVTLKEKITIDEAQGSVCYTLIDHALYNGQVYNKLIPPAEDDEKASPVVLFEMQWTPKTPEVVEIEDQVAPELRQSMVLAVQYVKSMAEQLEQESQKTGNPV